MKISEIIADKYKLRIPPTVYYELLADVQDAEEEQEPKYCDRSICIKNEYNGIGCNDCEVTKSQKQSGDLISRDAVIEQTYLWSKDEFLRITNPFDYLRKRIKNLPSINPQEPKTGHWINQDEGAFYPIECSECHKEPLLDSYGDYVFSNYCPVCGVRMI